MAVTNIPNVTNWSVTPQNGQVGYFTLMNTWLSESTAVIASLQKAINAQNTANSEINDLAIQVAGNAIDARNARNEALTAVATLQGGAIDNTTIAPNKAFSNQYTNSNFVKLIGSQTVDGVKTFSSSPEVPTPTTNKQAANKGYVDTKQANLGFVPVQQGTGIGQTGSVVKIGWSGTRTKITIEETDMGNIVMDGDIGVANSSLVKTALNASGTAPIYACRAWVNFNGTGTVAIRASGNVSSITDKGVGEYTVNFTTAMVDANYAVANGAQESFNTYGGVVIRGVSQLTTSVGVVFFSSGAASDNQNVSISIFR